MNREEFLDLVWKQRAVAIMRASSEEAARGGVEAAIRGGFRVVEFTMNTPNVLTLIAETARRPDVAVGAGTVLTTGDARAAVEAGARFLVSPVCDPQVIALAGELDVVAVPGCYTPTEMYRAYLAGAPLQKLFPAAATGPDAVRSIRGPMPFLNLVPTNGVDADNAVAYLEAGAFAVGFVRALFDPADMAAGHFDRIEERAVAMRARLDTVARGPRKRPS